MRFLNLSSVDKRFTRNVDTNELAWETPFLDLSDVNQFAVVSITIVTKKWSKDAKLVTFRTNLMDANYDNPHGIVGSELCKAKTIDYKPPVLAFWKVDSNRPRTISFGIEGADVSEILHVNFIICFC